MEKIFNPASVAVIGVSEKASNLGRHIAENLLRFNYRGKLYLVGQKAGELNGIPIFDSLDKVPDGIDLAIILTPACTTPDLLAHCGRKKITRVVIETAGFSESSAEGRVLEEQIRQIAREYNIRIVGPNCIGIVNTSGGMCTVFVRVEQSEILPGRTSFISQSGGVVLTMWDMLSAAGLGVAKEISVGNKLDLKESDYLDYLLKDPETDTCLLYLESIDDGRGLVDLAARGDKPIVVYKSNTAPASRRVAISHTAALANDEEVVNSAFKQFGIRRARSLRELVLFAKGFAMPPVRGNQLCVFTRSGGHAIIAADSASEFGFELAPFPQSLIDKAKPYFRADVIDTTNPLDLGTVFDFSSYAILIEECLQTVKPDAVLLVFNYRRETIPVAREIAEKLKQMSRQYQVPIALTYFTEMDELAYLERNLGFPIFTEVYDAIQALAASRDFHQWRQRFRAADAAELPASLVPADACAKAKQILQRQNGRQPLISDTLSIISAYGIPVAPWAVAKDLHQAAAAADQLGYPLAIKVVSETIVHKSDVGGVALNIRDADELAACIGAMQQRIRSVSPGSPFEFLLQKMVSGGREVILGGKRDRAFGPVILFGLGGIYVEVFKDAALRLAPLRPADAAEMIDEIQGSKLLRGVRGEPGVDLDALQDNLLRLSQLMIDLPEICEIDLNPVMASPDRVVAVDARMVI